jgi:hypothetical protein
MGFAASALRFAITPGLAIGLMIAAAGSSAAQSDRGGITGRVSDPQNAVIAGARVVVKDVDTGTEHRTITTETGDYTLTSLPARLYDVTIEAAGFKIFVLTGIRVQVAQATRVDATLAVGTTTETVSVTAEISMLKTDNAQQGINVSGDRINELPLNFGGGGGNVGAIRNWLGFVSLAPGVSGTNERASVNGAPGGAFKIYLEGQDVTSSNDTVWTSTVAAASVETIGEFSMQTANFSAEYGQVLGGVFNFTTKSGTNELHGSAYDYMTNEALDAHRPFTRARPLSRKHNFGFSAGGPVYLPKLYAGRNKTFFFANVEVFRNRTDSPGVRATVPTEAYRNGDFSAALTGRVLGTDPLGRPIMENAIYDPRTTRIVNGQVVRDPFPNNVIPSSLFDPVALRIQALIPRPDSGEILNNYSPDIQNHRYQMIPTVKIDHNFGAATRLSTYWSAQFTDQITSPDGFPIPITARRDQKIYGHTIRVNLDKTLNSNLQLHVGAGYLRFHNPDSSPDDVLTYDAARELGFIGSATTPSGFPVITGMGSNVAGGFPGNMGPGNANKYYNDKLTSVANMTYVRRQHLLKVGMEFKQEVWTDINKTYSQGQLFFNARQTGLPSTQGQNLGGGSVGLGYASFLLGLLDQAGVTAVRDPQWRKQAYSLYAQDNWRINRKLTFDYGLRWDYGGQGHERFYRTSQVGLTTPNPSAGGRLGGFVYEGYGPGRCNCDFTKTYPYAFGPRLGSTYRLDEKTVLRAGWGLTYSALSNWWYVTGGSSTLGVGFNSINWTNPAFGEAALRLRDGLVYNIDDLYQASFDPGIRPSPGQLNVPPAWGAQINDPNGGRPARVNQWNIGVQREIAKRIVLEAAYVGNRGVWLEANNLVSHNATPLTRFAELGLNLNNPADRTLLTSRIDSALAAARGFTVPYAGYPGSATVAQTLRPFPQFNDGLAVRWAPLGNTWYDALQLNLTQRQWHGLSLTAAFTWQHERALGSGGNPSAGGGPTNNVFDRAAQKGLAANSQPYIFVTSFNYITPRPERKVLGALLGGWTVAGLLRYASGQLIPVPGAQNNLFSLVFQNTRMNRVEGQPLFVKDPNCHCIDPRADFVLNPAAWSDPAPGQFGTSKAFYDDYRWQRQVTENFSVGRRFSTKGQTFFEIRAEFFNLFNRNYLRMPTDFNNNPLSTRTFNSQGQPTGGFGYINPTATPNTLPRNGQIVARFQF